LLLNLFRRPYRFFLLAAALALILCLFPIRTKEMEEKNAATAGYDHPRTDDAQGVPAGADLSERTAAGCMLHKTLVYAPCGHSVQIRDPLDARLIGLTRSALEKEISSVLPGTAVTGFSANEIDAAVSTDIPCPLHWVLRAGEDGMLCVMQNVSGEGMEVVRRADIPISEVPEGDRASLVQGRMFDDVQAMEGYLESLSS